MQFMVESQFAAPPTAEILALVPAEQACGTELDAGGVRCSFFLAADMSTTWQVFAVESRTSLETLLASFPLHAYLTERITELGDAG
jgi:muconolactone delta-isomerase